MQLCKLKYLNQYEKGEFDKGITINNTKNAEAQCFNSYNFLIRCLNTTIVTFRLWYISMK